MINEDVRSYFIAINNNLTNLITIKSNINSNIYYLEQLGINDTTIDKLNNLVEDIDNLELYKIKDELIKIFKELKG